MVGIACWQVVSRHILAFPAPLTEEMLRFLPVGINVSMAFVAGRETAYQPDSLTDKVSPTIRGCGILFCRSFLSRFPFWVLDYRRLKDFLRFLCCVPLR